MTSSRLPTAKQLAQWYAIVIETQEKLGVTLDGVTQNYLVVTLDAMTTDVTISSTQIAIPFLSSVSLKSLKDTRQLRVIGDQCLVLAGLFPEHANRRNVTDTYYIHMGQNAYYALAHTEQPTYLDKSIFSTLYQNFNLLIQVLRTMRM